MSTPVAVKPLGVVHSARSDLSDDGWGGVAASIEFDPEEVGADALAGLSDFSHVEIVFVFDQVRPDQVVAGARHPRGNPDWPLVGIFAQRGKNRPNRLGVSRCRVVAVDGLRLDVVGLDAVDGTPVLDVKPWMDEFAPIGPTRQPSWATELMAEYYTES